jgi:hypothetical protein
MVCGGNSRARLCSSSVTAATIALKSHDYLVQKATGKSDLFYPFDQDEEVKNDLARGNRSCVGVERRRMAGYPFRLSVAPD